MSVVGIVPAATRLSFTGGDRGWRGDVPIVRLNTDRIRSLGWSNRLSTRTALVSAMTDLLEDAKAGRLT